MDTERLKNDGCTDSVRNTSKLRFQNASGFCLKLQFYLLIILITFVFGCSSLNSSKSSESKMGSVLTIKGKEGTKCFVIIGFGIVRVNRPEGETAAVVTDSQALGISVSDQPGLKLGVGYSSNTVLTVPDGARAGDIRMEVSRRPFGSLEIITHSAKLKDFSAEGAKNAER